MDGEARRRLGQNLVRLAAGERDAFDEVFAGLWPPLLSLSRRLLGNDSEAEDAAQEALLKVFGRVDQYDASRDPLSWAFAITAFEARTIRRRRGRRREAGVAAEVGHGQFARGQDAVAADTPEIGLGVSAATPEAALIDAEIRSQLAAAVDLLSVSDRAEIEAYLGLAEGGQLGAARRKRRQRALERLKLIWRRLHGFHT